MNKIKEIRQRNPMIEQSRAEMDGIGPQRREKERRKGRTKKKDFALDCGTFTLHVVFLLSRAYPRAEQVSSSQ